MMRKISYVVLLAAVVLSACKNESFKKGKSGLEYKIISNGNGEKIKDGNFMQIHVGQYYNTGNKDSMMSDTRTSSGPLIEMLDTVSTPRQYYEILNQLRKGDSLCIRLLTDSAFAKSPQGMPPFFKKGHYLITTVKVIDIFTKREQADSARMAEMAIARKKDSINNAALAAKDEKTLTDYFTKNNIKATRAPLGTYVEIIQPGTGKNIDTSVAVVRTYYTGRTMEGVEFDSNTSKGKGDPLNVNLTTDMLLGMNVITGWKDGFSLVNKGTKAKFYIPSGLAYGANPPSADIKPNSILVFDIEIVDLLDLASAKIVAEADRKKKKEKQKKYFDSIRKANPDTSAKGRE